VGRGGEMKRVKKGEDGPSISLYVHKDGTLKPVKFILRRGQGEEGE
jgi:hypothetical protein